MRNKATFSSVSQMKKAMLSDLQSGFIGTTLFPFPVSLRPSGYFWSQNECFFFLTHRCAALSLSSSLFAFLRGEGSIV